MLSETVADALRAAYYYAMRDGHSTIDPALVLMAAARNDSRVARPVLGAAVADARYALPKVTSGPSGPATTTAALREARWWVCRDNDPARATPRGARQSWLPRNGGEPRDARHARVPAPPVGR
jgi:hypothetical protein